MKKWILTMILLGLAAGCTSPAVTATGGVAAGFAASETVKGAKADLARREAELIDFYNEGVEHGAEQEALDEIERQIRFVQYTRSGIETGEQFLGVDWTDPKQTGGAIGLAITTLLTILAGRKLNQTRKVLAGKDEGIDKFCGTHSPEVAGELHDIVKEKTNASVAS